MSSKEIQRLENLIKKYRPYNEQEQRDREFMLWYLAKFGSHALDRTCLSGHFTTSVFLFNKKHTKTLMCYHLIDKSWAWLGGHADGIADVKSVVLREVGEEAGIGCQLINDGEVSALTCIPIGGYVKNGEYVSSHIHLDVAFVGEADENDELTPQLEENSEVKWIDIAEVKNWVTDRWKMENTYQKFIEQFK